MKIMVLILIKLMMINKKNNKLNKSNINDFIKK